MIMKKIIVKFTLVLCLSFGMFACSPDITQELHVENPEQTSDPDETPPGCGEPEGCDSDSR